MYRVTVGLIVFLVVCANLWLAANSLSHQSKLARRAREIRQERQTRQTSQSDPGETKCRYKVALLDFPPYIITKNTSSKQGFMYETIKDYVDLACFNRERKIDPEVCNMEPIFARDSDEMVQLIQDKEVNFAFPILSDIRAKLKAEPGVTLIRAFVSSGCSMIVNTKLCEHGSREQLLTSITSQWPILACIILLSGISGVVIWVFEHRTNTVQFSPSFAVGSPQGFWWAIVSLTTVGYGDKIPRSPLGRIFSIIWILVGAILLSLFTATVTNAMNTALDGSKCKDVSGKEVGVFIKNIDTQIVAREYDATIVEFSSLEEMQDNLSKGTIGRVLVDRNTAFYFLDKSGLKRSRQIRMIRNIDYPMEYYLAHVYTGPVNITNDSDTELAKRRQQVVECGPQFIKRATDLRGESKSASSQLIPAELQTADLFDQMEGLFSSGSAMTRFILFSLLGIFLGLVIIGIFWEVYNTCILRRRKDMHKREQGPENGDQGDPIHFNRKKYVIENFQSLEERLKELTNDLQKTKEDFAKALLNQESNVPLEDTMSSTLLQ